MTWDEVCVCVCVHVHACVCVCVCVFVHMRMHGEPCTHINKVNAEGALCAQDCFGCGK